MKTLLIDGNNLLSIGFNAVTFFYKNVHIGGLFHFMNTTRKLINEHNFDKIVVFWDGEGYKEIRRKYYPNYKIKRKKNFDESSERSFERQKKRIQQYLEEVFIRQIEVERQEADDLISYYCQISENEEKTILSSDKDLLQLIGDKIEIYNPIEKIFYSTGSKIKLKNNIYMPIENILTYKIFLGDKSDDIEGIKSLGEGKFIKFFPEILDKTVSFTDILDKTKELLVNNKSLTLKNIINGKRKDNEEKENYYRTNLILMDLSSPLLREEGIRIVNETQTESFDPSGRSHKNMMRMMMEDGLFKFLIKEDNGWASFIQPFMKIIRKETIFNNKK